LMAAVLAMVLAMVPVLGLHLSANTAILSSGVGKQYSP